MFSFLPKTPRTDFKLSSALLLFWCALIGLLISGCSSGSDPTGSSEWSSYDGSIYGRNSFQECGEHLDLGVPGNPDQVLCRDAYAVGYNYQTKTPDWAAYHITAESVSASYPRNDRFREDTDVPEAYSASLADYAGSGYDRGHMAPNATVDYSFTAMDESFLLSNIAPQLPNFNRGVWAKLEDYMRNCVNEVGELVVVTGAISKGSTTRIGDGVVVPTAFYKAAIKPTSPAGAMAFLLPHEAGLPSDDLGRFLISVNDLEAETGIDLFENVRDDVEIKIEVGTSPICSAPWVRNYVAPHAPPNSSGSAGSQSGSNTFSCSISKNCSQMSSCREAYFYLNTCGDDDLDRDNDGVPCEANPCPRN